MKGYWLVLGSAVTDPAAREKYAALWAPIAELYGARVLPAGSSVDLREGTSIARCLLVEFPTIQAARDCYADPSYQTAKDFALAASDRILVIIEGDIP